MSGGFTAELAALQKLSKDLSDCTTELEHGLDALKEIGPKGLGYDFLDEACEHFGDKWDNGLNRIRDIVEDVADKVGKIGKEYAKNESGVIDSLKNVGSGE
jgi:uncharacterized protein YukE